VNPAWARALARLHTAAVAPLLGADKTWLTPEDWAALAERLRPYESWIGTRPASPVAKLGIERINAILAGPGRKALADLFGEDRALAPRVAALADVERLALFARDLGTLLRNFVNFSDFYSRARPAVFQAGTLYLDSRSCRLCIRVEDFGAHAPFATMSRVYVAYLECRRPGGETLKIAAAVTQGDSDYLFVQGATASSTTARGATGTRRSSRSSTARSASGSPSSAPYKKVASFVGDQFAKFAASKDKLVQSTLEKTRHRAAEAAQPAAPVAPLRHREVRRHLRRRRARPGAIGVALAAVFSGVENLPALGEAPRGAGGCSWSSRGRRCSSRP
jgi:hypothetical protein